MQNKLGLFPWYSLATKDPTASMKYYEELLGLNRGEFEMPGLGKTFILQKGPVGFADFSNVPSHTPCHWSMYITVENVDQFLPKAIRLGGTVEGKPFDIPTIGRGAMIKDPSGALFIAYTPLNWKTTTSAMGTEEGMICWNELIVNEPKKVIPFYSECFGWKFEGMDHMGEMEYHSFTCQGEQIGGIMKTPAHAGHMPPMWMAYFLVKDLVTSTEKAKKLGGAICMDITEIPTIGKIFNG